MSLMDYSDDELLDMVNDVIASMKRVRFLFGNGFTTTGIYRQAFEQFYQLRRTLNARI